jgi:hypothetical protein
MGECYAAIQTGGEESQCWLCDYLKYNFHICGGY